MVVACPKCKMKLKVSDEKISPEGSRFKCPKCSIVLMVKKPQLKAKPQENKVIAAHENPSVLERISSVLTQSGYTVITSQDGIDTMIKAVKELPFLAILDVALPKIYGFEVCKRLKEREETKEIKVILISSIYDKTRYRREPMSLHGADDYIEEHQIEQLLIEKVIALKGAPPRREEYLEQPKEKDAEIPTPAPTSTIEEQPKEKEEEYIIKSPQSVVPDVAKMAVKGIDEGIEKARRLARTIVSDIYLYSSTKMEESIKKNSFYSDFATEIKEGKKLYDDRVPLEVRNKGDFFREAIENFIENKKKALKS